MRAHERSAENAPGQSRKKMNDASLGRRDTQEDKGREGDRQGSAGVEENNRELVHGGLRSLDPTATMLRLIG